MSERQFNYPQRKRSLNNDVSTQKGIQNRDVNAAMRVQEALKLRAQMLTYDEIAKRCGYATRDSARKAVLRELDRSLPQNTDEMRKAELHMLNILHGKCWERFTDEKNPYSYSEVERILKISERRCKLMGLDVPVDNALMSNVVVVREVPAGLLSVVEQAQ